MPTAYSAMHQSQLKKKEIHKLQPIYTAFQLALNTKMVQSCRDSSGSAMATNKSINTLYLETHK